MEIADHQVSVSLAEIQDVTQEFVLKIRIDSGVEVEIPSAEEETLSVEEEGEALDVSIASEGMVEVEAQGDLEALEEGGGGEYSCEILSFSRNTKYYNCRNFDVIVAFVPQLRFSIKDFISRLIFIFLGVGNCPIR